MCLTGGIFNVVQWFLACRLHRGANIQTSAFLCCPSLMRTMDVSVLAAR